MRYSPIADTLKELYNSTYRSYYYLLNAHSDMKRFQKATCGTSWTAWTLVVIGALNWGLIGVGNFLGADWNVVKLLLSNFPAIEWIIYILVGIAGIVALFGCKCKTCRSNRDDTEPHEKEKE